MSRHIYIYIYLLSIFFPGMNSPLNRVYLLSGVIQRTKRKDNSSSDGTRAGAGVVVGCCDDIQRQSVKRLSCCQFTSHVRPLFLGECTSIDSIRYHVYCCLRNRDWYGW